MNEPGDVTVRPAKPAERERAAGIVDAAMLDADVEGATEVLVAVADGRILGTLVAHDVAAGVEIDAVAVRRRRRGQGIGTALVETALARHGRVVAAFDGDVRPFYEALGFAIEERGDGRYRGVRESKRA